MADYTGGPGPDTLVGGAGNDTLDGQGGADTMIGGAGDDTYYVDNLLDQVVENADEGIDTVISLVSYILSANVENLTLAGSAVFGLGNALDNTLTGNALDNTLLGDDGNDRLDGGLGGDLLVGGVGNDTYMIDNAGDVISETSGTDTVESSISYVLGSGLENLVLTGAGAISGEGNAGANTITGNSASNLLIGRGGADSIDGGGGIDTAQVAGSATITANAGNWTVVSSDGTDTLTHIEIVAHGAGHTLLVGATGFATIQEAVDAASSGDTILIAAGHYREQVLVSGKDLTIRAFDGAVLEMPDQANITSSGGYNSALTVVGANVDVINLDIDGREQGGPFVTQTFAGVAFINANGSSFADGHITGFHAPPAQHGNQNGYGILVRSTSGSHSVEISGSTIDDFQKNGIDARGAGLFVNIHDNVITGWGATAAPAQNGVVILGATGIVDGNTISALGYTGAGNIATGVLVYDSDGVDVTDNVVTMAGTTSHSTAIHVFNAEPGTISGNTVSGAEIGIEQIGSFNAPAEVGGNTFSDLLLNLAFDPDDAAATAYDVDGTSGTDYLDGAAGDDTLDGGAGTDLIVGGAGKDTTHVAGAASFAVVGGVWTVTSSDGVDGLIGVEIVEHGGGRTLLVGLGAFTTIQAAVNEAHAGDTVMIADGTYTENVTLSKAITLQAVNPGGVTIDPASGNGITISGDIDQGGTATVSIDGINVNGADAGIQVSSSTDLTTLSVANGSFTGNATYAIGTGSGAPLLGNVIITDSTFTNNGVGPASPNGSGAIVLFGFTGNATLEGLDITTTSTASTPQADRADNAIQITGANPSTYDVTSPAGTIVFEDVVITGYYHKAALTIQGYTDLSGISFENSSISTGSNWGYPVFVDPVVTTGTGAAGVAGSPGYFAGGADESTLDLSGLAVTNLSAFPFDVFVRGTDADDTQIGTNANDWLNQPSEGGIDRGGDDTLEGRGGDDVLFGGGGNDDLDGGAGNNDIAVFSGARAGYLVAMEVDDNGFVTAFTSVKDTDAGNGDEGTDGLTGIEKLAFGDVTLVLGDDVQLFSGGVLTGTFATISDAVTAAANGDTIRVSAGTYNEALTINKDVTIEGANAGVNGSGTRGLEAIVTGGVTITASGVTIDGMKFSGEVTGPGANGPSGIYASGNNLTIVNSVFDSASTTVYYAILTQQVTGLEVSDNLFQGYPAGVYASGDTTGSIDHNRFQGEWSAGDVEPYAGMGNGVLSESVSLDIANNTFDALYSGAVYALAGSPTSIEIGDFVHDNVYSNGLAARPIQIYPNFNVTTVIGSDQNEAFVGSDAYPSGRAFDFSGEGGADRLYGGDLGDTLSGGAGDDGLFGYGGDDSLDGGDGSDALDGGAGIDSATVSTVSSISANGSNWTVISAEGTDTLVNVEIVEDGSSRTLLVGSGGFNTLQDAVDAANSGDTILVAAGCYTGDTVVDVSVTILGANAGIPGSEGRDDESVLKGTVTIAAAGVTIDGVQFSGESTASGPPWPVGVNVTSAGNDLTIVNSTFETDFDYGAGDIVGVATSTVTGLDLSDNLFHGYSVGVYLTAGTTGAIENNVFDGDWSPGDLTFVGMGNGVNTESTSVTIANNDFDSLYSGAINVLAAGPAAIDLDDFIGENEYDGGRPDQPIRIWPNGVVSTVTGTDANEWFRGHEGGASGPFTVHGEGGDDQLTGGTLGDTLDGGEGHDLLSGGGGNDTLTGGLGSDELDGGADIDTATYSGTLTAGSFTYSGGHWHVGGDTLEGVEVVTDGSGHVFRLVGADGTDGYGSIQSALDASATGDEILVSAGAYDPFTVNTDVTIRGVGSVTIEGTFRDNNPSLPNGVSVGEWLKTATGYTGGGNGATIAADGVTLENLTFTSSYVGVSIGNSDNLTLTNVNVTDSVHGVAKIGSTVASGFTMTGGTISDSYIGFLVESNGHTDAQFDNVLLDGVHFQNLTEKGIYADNLSNADLLDLVMTNVGEFGRGPAFGAAGKGEYGAGIDINLKYGDYSDIEIAGFQFTDVGSSSEPDTIPLDFGAAITIKARDDGSYGGANAATLTDVSIHDGTINGTATGVRIGEPGKGNAGPTNVTVTNVAISGADFASFDNASLATLTVIGTTGADLYTTGATTVGKVDYSGGDDNDVLTGGIANDTLSGGLGDDQLNGGDGNDILAGGAGVDVLTGGSGLDTALLPTSTGLLDTLVGWVSMGTDGNDFLTGVELAVGPQRSLLVGGTGFGAITAALVSSLIQNGDNIRLAQGSYSGSFTFSNSGLTVYGQTSTLNVTLTSASNFGITVYGGGSADTITTGGGSDTINGGGGNDVLNGGAGIDTMIGGLGNDQFYVDNAGDTVSEATGEGTDRIFATANYVLAAGVSVETLSTDSATATTAINLTGNELVNNVYGNYGNNVLTGGGANDVIIAHDGNDTLDGGTGADSMTGGLGDDWYYVDTAGDMISEVAGQGNDRVFSSVTYTLAAGLSIETLSTDNAAATTAINLTGNEIANTIFGNDGNNSLNGGSGNDTITGGGGNDTITGGMGTDTMSGGLGDDWYYTDSSTDVVSEAAGQGNDRILTASNYVLAAGVSVETVSTDNAAATTAITLIGNEIGNNLYGNFGNNSLYGSGGNDVIIAHDGNDLLNGGAGADSLTGGTGADTFVFANAAGAGNIDTIADYNVADDTIQIDDAIFTGLSLGALAAGAFNTGASASQADDRIIYNSATGALLFDVDGVGGVAAVQFATLSTGLALSAGEFVVI